MFYEKIETICNRCGETISELPMIESRNVMAMHAIECDSTDEN